MGMLEDMSIAIRDLSAVKFKVCIIYLRENVKIGIVF